MMGRPSSKIAEKRSFEIFRRISLQRPKNHNIWQDVYYLVEVSVLTSEWHYHNFGHVPVVACKK